MNIYQSGIINGFKCLKDACHDDCCSGWTVNVDKNKLEQWGEKQPELLKSIEENPYRPECFRMHLKSDEKKSCGMLKDGLCEIHSWYGPETLPDVCKIFPFRTIKSGNDLLFTASTACPAVAFSALEKEDKGKFKFTDSNKKLKPVNYVCEINPNIVVPENLSTEYCVGVYHKVISRIEDHKTADSAALWLLFMGYRVYDSYTAGAKTINGCFPLSAYDVLSECRKHNETEDNSEEVYFYIEKMLELLGRIVTRRRPVINSVFEILEKGLSDSHTLENCIKMWRENSSLYNHYLKSFLKSKITESFFPFNIMEDEGFQYVSIITLEYLVIRLVLMFEKKEALTENRIVKICHAVDREFYSKKTSFIVNLISYAGISCREILIDMVRCME